MTNQLLKVRKSLQERLGRRCEEINRAAGALYALLDRRAAPVHAQEAMTQLDVSPETYRLARWLLLRSYPVYVTPEGLVLKDHASKEHRFWHLAWSMGLFEMSSQQFTLDEDILDRTPEGVLKLLQAEAPDLLRIEKLQKQAKDMREYALRVAEMYDRVCRALEAGRRAQLPAPRKEVRGKWSKETWEEIKKHLKGK